MALGCLPRCFSLSQDLPKRTAVESLKSALAGVVGGGRSATLAEGGSEDEGAAALLLRSLDLKASTEPARFRARPEQIPNLLLASLPALARLGSGAFAQDYRVSLARGDPRKYSILAFRTLRLEESGVFRAPALPLVLYDVESCPRCRLVREACSMLSLSVTFRPSLRGGRGRALEEARRIFGEGSAAASPPLLVDPNTSVKLSDTDAILQYLFRAYGSGQVPWTLRGGAVSVATSAAGVVLLRWGAGGWYRSSNPPPDGSPPLVLWSYEGSPFCKVVRETLSSLEICHTVVHAPRGSPNRQRLFERKGFFQVPYLEDPNTGVCLHESEAINEYLVKRYAVSAPPVKYI
jgi:glutathione S-transferase